MIASQIDFFLYDHFQTPRSFAFKTNQRQKRNATLQSLQEKKNKKTCVSKKVYHVNLFIFLSSISFFI